MKINRTFNPKSRDLVRDFPKWSAAYGDPNSNTNRLINPFANVMEYQENTIAEIYSDSTASTIDTDRHAFKRWIADFRDVIGYDTDNAADEGEFIGAIDSVVGTIDGEDILISELATEGEFYEPYMQTAWYVSGIIEHGIEGQLNTCEIIDNKLYIHNVSGSTGRYDPSLIHVVEMSHRWIPNINKNEDISVTEVANPVYENVSIEITTKTADQRVLLDHQLSSVAIDKIIITDEIASAASGETIYLESGYSIVDTSTYKVMDVFIGDLDNDEIIDSRELDIMTANLGKSRKDYTADEWSSTYSKYDINGDGIINSADMTIIENLQTAIQRDVTAISFDTPGKYTIDYAIGDNNEPDITSIINVGGVPEYFRNTTYGYMNSYWPSGYVDGTYDAHKSIYYYIDNSSKCLWVYEKDVLENTYDRYKIILPIQTNMELRGIVYSMYRIYILAMIDGISYIITVRTDLDNPEDDITIVPIHSGQRLSTDVDILLRDEAGVSYAASGLTMVNDSKLITIDGDAIKVLLPIHDYYVRSVDETDRNTLSLKEKYETLALTPSGEISPVYQNLWNMIDHHGQSKGIRRLPGETNASFKNRILDVFVHFPSRDKQGALYGIQRELGLTVEDVYEPEINLLPEGIDHRNADTIKIFNDTEKVEYDEIAVEHQYDHGKYSHDKIMYKVSGETILTIDKDIVV